MRAELFDCVRDDLGSRAHGSSTRCELLARSVELGFEALEDLGGAVLEIRRNSDAGGFDEMGVHFVLGIASTMKREHGDAQHCAFRG